MVYCPKCGTKNEDDATFCKKCGATLDFSRKEWKKERDDHCEEECSGGKDGRGWSVFWGIIIILIGLFIIFEIILKDVAKTIPGFDWVTSIQFGWLFAAVFALFIIIFGIRILSRR